MGTAPTVRQYEVALELDQLLAPPRTPVRVCAPPQFGSNASWSAEYLLAGAVLTSVRTTFDAIARTRRLLVYGWYGRVVAIVERDTDLMAMRVELNITTDAGEEDRVRETIATVERTCFIARALSVPIEFACTVTTRSAEALC